MTTIRILPTKDLDCSALIALCPFNAIEKVETGIDINSGCRMCRVCTKLRPDVFELVEDVAITQIDKSKWKGIAIYVEHIDNKIHPVSLELIGKARELANKTSQPVLCLVICEKDTSLTTSLLEYGVDSVYVYENTSLKHFNIEPYTAVFEDFINKLMPSTVLVGGTPIGRSLAPRIAARFRTGLTADCTILDMAENTDLDQIRPAYGGNIMAHIHTPNHRPQLATVRYKIFNAPEKVTPFGKIFKCKIDAKKLKTNIRIIEIKPKEKVKSIEDAEIIIVAGKGIKKKSDLAMIYELANALGGMTAGTRPLMEQGWFDPRQQIGLSGRTVKPKLIITCGVSGSVQFTAGMQGADTIISINNDPKASIFNLAHYAIIGDIYDVIPSLLTKIRKCGSAI